jgi:hypothetical protein
MQPAQPLSQPVARESYQRFVYPFFFDGRNYVEHVSRVQQAAWGSGEKKIAVWVPDSFPDQELLPQVAKYVNTAAVEHSTARVWQLDPNALRSSAGLGVNSDWLLSLPTKTPPLPFRLEDARLALFRFGVGFLTVDVRPAQEDLASWLDFLHYFRFADEHRGGRVTVQRRTGPSAIEPFLPPPVAANNAVASSASELTMQQILDVLAATGQAKAPGRWAEPAYIRGQLIPYAVLYLDDCPQDFTPELIHRLRNLFHSRQQAHLSAQDQQPDDPSLLAYAARQWFIMSRDGGSFLACDAPRTEFFRQVLPDHLSKHYFLVFLFVLNQHFTLSRLSEDLAEHWLRWKHFGGSPRERQRREVAAFHGLVNRLLEFTSRGSFGQICHRQHHHRYYVALQEFFTIDRLYQEVKDGIREANDQLLLRQNQHIDARMRGLERLAFVFTAAGLLLAVLAIGVEGMSVAETIDRPSQWSALAAVRVVLALVVCGLVVLFWRRWQSKAESEDVPTETDGNQTQSTTSALP